MSAYGPSGDALVIHIPAGEVPSDGGYWSMSRHDPWSKVPVRTHEVEVWDGLGGDVFRIPNEEVMNFLVEMKKKYGS